MGAFVVLTTGEKMKKLTKNQKERVALERLNDDLCDAVEHTIGGLESSLVTYMGLTFFYEAAFDLAPNKKEACRLIEHALNTVKKEKEVA